eukprot:RCo013304
MSSMSSGNHRFFSTAELSPQVESSSGDEYPANNSDPGERRQSLRGASLWWAGQNLWLQATMGRQQVGSAELDERLQIISARQREELQLKAHPELPPSLHGEKSPPHEGGGDSRRCSPVASSPPSCVACPHPAESLLVDLPKGFGRLTLSATDPSALMRCPDSELVTVDSTTANRTLTGALTLGSCGGHSAVQWPTLGSGWRMEFSPRAPMEDPVELEAAIFAAVREVAYEKDFQQAFAALFSHGTTPEVSAVEKPPAPTPSPQPPEQLQPPQWRAKAMALQQKNAALQEELAKLRAELEPDRKPGPPQPPSPVPVPPLSPPAAVEQGDSKPILETAAKRNSLPAMEQPCSCGSRGFWAVVRAVIKVAVLFLLAAVMAAVLIFRAQGPTGPMTHPDSAHTQLLSPPEYHSLSL